MTRKEMRKAARRRRTRRRLLLTASIGVFAAGAALLAANLLAPTEVERVVGEAKVKVAEAVEDTVSEVTGNPAPLPSVRLGEEGGKRELDRCDGTFTELTSYRIGEVLPVYAAHNNCGGDIILSWNVGDRVSVEGSGVTYEVVEERHTRKWAQVSSLRGMTGELLLQTCYYGQDKMRFLALEPVS
jgi:hypothetical protein